MKASYCSVKTDCFGCSACASVCPKHAITMQPDGEGFLFPILDESACISCGLCGRVCPAVQKDIICENSHVAETVFAGWRTDTQARMQSTSGGVFAALAESFLTQENAVVYGAAFQDGCEVRHIRVDDPQKLACLRGSKYVQSDMRGIYEQVQDDLKAGKRVLFSGTPCQVAAIQLFCCRQRENLLTVDLVCHGVPSPLMFRKYLDDLGERRHGKVTEFKFRAKKKSGYRAYLNYTIDGTKKYSVLAGLEPYAKGFYGGYFNRETCYHCPFANTNRPGDITLCDYWGLEKSHPELRSETKYGVSAILCNTEAGKKILEKASEGLILKGSTLEKTSRNHNLSSSIARPVFRNQAYVLLNRYGFACLRRKHLKVRFRLLHLLTPMWFKNLLRRILK